MKIDIADIISKISVGIAIMYIIIKFMSLVAVKTEIVKYELYFIRDEWTAFTNTSLSYEDDVKRLELYDVLFPYIDAKYPDIYGEAYDLALNILRIDKEYH